MCTLLSYALSSFGLGIFRDVVFGWIDVNHSVLDLVGHIQSVLGPSVLKWLPFESIQKSGDTCWSYISQLIAVKTKPCYAALYLLQVLVLVVLIGKSP